MRALQLTGLALALLAGACDDSDSSQPPRSIAVRSEAQTSLHRLSEMSQKIALRRAIYDSGKVCRRVDKSGYVQEYGNLSMWTASCDSGRSFAIFIGPDGSAQVRDCKEMEPLKLPACIIKGEPAKPNG